MPECWTGSPRCCARKGRSAGGIPARTWDHPTDGYAALSPAMSRCLSARCAAGLFDDLGVVGFVLAHVGVLGPEARKILADVAFFVASPALLLVVLSLVKYATA